MDALSKEAKHGSSNQQASPSADKNTGVVLVPCHAWKYVSTAISWFVDISEVSGCNFLWQISSQWGVIIITSRISVSLTHSLPFCCGPFLTQLIMAILSKGCKPDNFESNNSLKLILQIFVAFVRTSLNMNLSLNQTLLTFWLNVRQTLMTLLILVISLWGVIFL